MPASPVTSLDVHPAGDLIVSLHKDNIISVWDALTGRNLVNIPDPTKRITRVSFSPDGNLVLCLPRGSTEPRVLDWRNSHFLAGFEGVFTNVVDVAFFPSGSLLASVHADNAIRVWNVSTGGLLKTSEPYAKDVKGIGVSPFAPYVIVMLDGETIVYQTR
jgi:WD40 repeat protein